MSVQAIGWALGQDVGTPTRKVVLIALANRVNSDTGLCCPSLKTVAKETCLAKSSVIRALHELEQAGYIQRVQRQRENGSHTSTEYRFPQLTPSARVTPPLSHSGTTPSPTVTPPEPELRTGSKEPLAAAPRVPHNAVSGFSPKAKPSKDQRDEVWDALTDIFGPALTRSAEQLRGKHVASLAEAGATRDEIFARAKRWPLHFENATLTAAALEKHWDTLNRKPLRRTG